MTGFGRGEASSSGFQITVEIKTLNSRFLDISARLPQAIQHKELVLKELVQAKLSRGKANINVYINKTSTSHPGITHNAELVKNYTRLLEQIRSEANIPGSVELRDLLQFDDIFEHKKENEKEIGIIWECTSQALDMALDHLNKMRQKEGAG